jgi:hypothetical protein
VILNRLGLSVTEQRQFDESFGYKVTKIQKLAGMEGGKGVASNLVVVEVRGALRSAYDLFKAPKIKKAARPKETITADTHPLGWIWNLFFDQENAPRFQMRVSLISFFLSAKEARQTLEEDRAKLTGDEDAETEKALPSFVSNNLSKEDQAFFDWLRQLPGFSEVVLGTAAGAALQAVPVLGIIVSYLIATDKIADLISTYVDDSAAIARIQRMQEMNAANAPPAGSKKVKLPSGADSASQQKAAIIRKDLRKRLKYARELIHAYRSEHVKEKAKSVAGAAAVAVGQIIPFLPSVVVASAVLSANVVLLLKELHDTWNDFIKVNAFLSKGRPKTIENIEELWGYCSEIPALSYQVIAGAIRMKAENVDDASSLLSEFAAEDFIEGLATVAESLGFFANCFAFLTDAKSEDRAQLSENILSWANKLREGEWLQLYPCAPPHAGMSPRPPGVPRTLAPPNKVPTPPKTKKSSE